jgi:aquaporin Z
MSTTKAARADWPIAHYEQSIIDRIADFDDPRQEWRRLFAEMFGTFLLVLVAAGGGMIGHAFPGMITRTDAVVAPGLMVMGVILFMGKVSGAHLNPAISIAFALRQDFPWRRVPGYIVAQLVGATLAALFLQAVIHVSATYGSNYPTSAYSATAAFWMEAMLTLGLVSVILGTASGAQNVGLFGALGVAGYLALAGLWGSPISGASMDPARTFGPDLVSGNFSHYIVYVAGPIAGAVVAVGIAFILRGRGGGSAESGAGQGALFTKTHDPTNSETPSRTTGRRLSSGGSKSTRRA